MGKGACAFLCVAFFFFWMMLDDPVIGPDSHGYITFFVSREPVYPLFLAMCRNLPFASVLSVEGYAGIRYAVFFQNLLWAYAVYRAGCFVFRLSRELQWKTKRGPYAMMWAAVGFQLAVCLINRLFADRHMLYSNLINTEALAMPLFLLFVIRLWNLLQDETRKNLLLCAVLTFLLIGIRKQMQIVLIVWFLMTVLYRLAIRRCRNPKAVAVQVVCMVCVVLCTRLADAVYHAAVHGFFGHVDSGEALLCCMLYTAEEEDAALFSEEESRERQWFMEIMKEQQERGALLRALPEDAGIVERASHFAEHYDVIGYEIVHPVLLADPGLAGMRDDVSRTRQMYAEEGKLASILRRQNLGDYFGVFGANLVSGLAFSVARMSSRLLPVVAVLYLLYIALLIFSVRKRGDRDKTGGTVMFAVIVICSIVVNSVVTGALIFPQGRYMIYSMGFFYTALLMMALTIAKKRG